MKFSVTVSVRTEVKVLILYLHSIVEVLMYDNSIITVIIMSYWQDQDKPRMAENKLRSKISRSDWLKAQIDSTADQHRRQNVKMNHRSELCQVSAEATTAEASKISRIMRSHQLFERLFSFSRIHPSLFSTLLELMLWYLVLVSKLLLQNQRFSVSFWRQQCNDENKQRIQLLLVPQCW